MHIPFLRKDKKDSRIIESLDSQLLKKLEICAKVNGYLILVTTLKGTQLNHTYFTKEFPKGDLMPTLDEYAKILEKEVSK